MTVAIAYQVPDTTQPALEEAVRQADYHQSELVIIHIAETFDGDDAEHYRVSLSDDLERALAADHIPDVPWRLELATPQDHGRDVSGAILSLCAAAEAELLVIGARRRSPVGKAFLGSLAQNLILDAEIPVIVVKAG
ncbi:MAG: universal stress protein [Actinomycetales bacterium]